MCCPCYTAWARNAFNSLDYINNYLIPNNFHIYPITQLQDDKLGIQSVVANTNINVPNQQNILVWDIGGGSFQLGLYYNNDNSIYIYNGPYGSANFQGLLTSNGLPTTPLNRLEVVTAKSLAHDAIPKYLEQDRIVTDKTSYATVYAVGLLMNFAIKPLFSKSVYSQDDIENLIADFFVGNTDVITLR